MDINQQLLPFDEAESLETSLDTEQGIGRPSDRFDVSITKSELSQYWLMHTIEREALYGYYREKQQVDEPPRMEIYHLKQLQIW